MKYEKTIKGDYTFNPADDLSAVKEITGDLIIPEGSEATADALTSVGGDVSVSDNATFTGSANLKTHDSEAKEKCKKHTFETFLKLGFLFVDGILAKLISKKGNVYKVTIIGQQNVSYVVEKDGQFSHGETLQEANADLRFKLAKERGAEQYKSIKLHDSHEVLFWVEAYRIITGACRFGTEHFLKSVTLKKEKYMLSEVLEITNGQYGSAAFSNFFGNFKQKECS